MAARAPSVDELIVLRKDADGRTVGRVRVVIRPDGVADLLALLALAERAERPVPPGPLLVAEADGVLRAAAGSPGTDTLADPGFPASLLLELLLERLERDRLGRSGRRLRRWRDRLAQWERLWAAARPGVRDLRRLDALRSGSAGPCTHHTS